MEELMSDDVDELKRKLRAVKEVLRDCATALHADRGHEGKFKNCYRFGCSSAILVLKSK